MINECPIADFHYTKDTYTFIRDVRDDVVTLICSSADLESQQRINKSRFSYKPDGLNRLDLVVHFEEL